MELWLQNVRNSALRIDGCANSRLRQIVEEGDRKDQFPTALQHARRFRKGLLIVRNVFKDILGQNDVEAAISK